MKKAALILWGLGHVIVILSYGANYWLGYSETKTALFFANRLLACGLELILFGALFLLLLSLVFPQCRKNFLWVLIAFFGFWPSVILTYLIVGLVFCSDQSITICGLRNRVMQEYGTEGLRSLAREVKVSGIFDNVNEEFISNDPSVFSQLTPKQKKAFGQLSQKYPFLFRGLDKNEFQADIGYEEKTQSIVFTWSNVDDVPQFWGIAISVTGRKPEMEEVYNKPTNHAEILQPSNDIEIFYDDGLLD